MEGVRCRAGAGGTAALAAGGRWGAVPRPPATPELFAALSAGAGAPTEVSWGPSRFSQLPVRLWPGLGLCRWEDRASAPKRGEW